MKGHSYNEQLLRLGTYYRKRSTALHFFDLIVNNCRSSPKIYHSGNSFAESRQHLRYTSVQTISSKLSEFTLEARHGVKHFRARKLFTDVLKEIVHRHWLTSNFFSGLLYPRLLARVAQVTRNIWAEQLKSCRNRPS